MSGLRSTMNSKLEKLTGEVRIMLVGCDNAANIAKLHGPSVAVMSLPCTAMLPPSFIEFALREHRVDGILITGCREHDCYHRMGVLWTEQRLTAKREPRLRSRAERERIRRFWASSSDIKKLESELESFRISLSLLIESEKVSESQSESHEL
jgi:coenzyme F420-reducing hydrogenase delta subunit